MWLPHSKHSSHGQLANWINRHKHFCIYIYQNTTNWNFYYKCYCQIYVSNKYAYQIGHMCHLYQILTRYILEMYAHIFAHMKWLVPTIQWVLYTYLTYITIQIWLQHSKYQSHGKHAKWAYRPNIFGYLFLNN